MTDDALSPRTADTINRQAVIDIYMQRRFGGSEEVISAINAIPAATVTDDMVERACAAMLAAYLRNSLPAWDKRIMKEALIAALGE